MIPKLQTVRGTKDLLGDEINLFNRIVKLAKDKSAAFGFSEIQTPIFEFSELYERNLGEETDMVSKEVYKFPDRGDNMLTLRPEFTAGVVRAFINNNLHQTLPQKLFSSGPLFRYDRPQKGRQRQFHQINFEIIGSDSIYYDVEVIALANSILSELNLSSKPRLEINSIGSSEIKAKYEDALREFFAKYKDELSDDSKVRLEKNPLRILDSKDQSDIKLAQSAPKVSEFLDDVAKKRIDDIISILAGMGIESTLNQNLVRGIDYYTSTVFEFVDTSREAQNTVLAGGRYDDLVGKMSGKSIPAIGFAGGVERLMLISSIDQVKPDSTFVTYVSKDEERQAFLLTLKLREAGIACDFIPNINFKKQFSKANQANAKKVLILGGDEVKRGVVKVKDFTKSSEVEVSASDVIKFLTDDCNS